MRYSFITSLVDTYEDLGNLIVSIEKAHEFTRDIEIEVLVVFKGDEDKSGLVRSRYPHLIKTWTLSGIGLSEGRNVGIEKSSGDYLIFIDDDATVKEDFIERLELNTKSRSYGAFCGRILNPSDGSPFRRCYEDGKSRVLRAFDFSYFAGSAIILRRDVIEKIGLFDEEFGSGAKYYGGEDSDIFFRLKRGGEDILYLPEVVFYHHVLDRYDRVKIFNYAYAVGAMLMKQIMNDRPHFYIYSAIMLKMLLGKLARMAHDILFPDAVAGSNSGHCDNLVFKGIIKGAVDYFRFEAA